MLILLRLTILYFTDSRFEIVQGQARHLRLQTLEIHYDNILQIARVFDKHESTFWRFNEQF